MGWRKINGVYLYLTTGGPLGPDGPVSDVEVALGDSRLSLYSLPAPAGPEARVAAIRASLALLKLARGEVTYPLVAATYRAPLGEVCTIDVALFYAGGTGVQKTELTAMAQAHYGAGFHAKALPGNWSTTVNSLEKQAFVVKDALFTVDDFAPCGTAADVQRLHRDADRLFRGQGNQTGRGRMRADCTFRPEYYPRGLVVSSGEDVPNGHSVRARMVVVEVTRGDVDLGRLTQVQADAAEGKLAQAMAGYITWLAPQMEGLRPVLEARRKELRAAARTRGAGHDRTPENIASLQIGLEMVLRYAEQSGAITAAEREHHAQRGWEALLRLADVQTELQGGEEPTRRFLSLLSGVLTAGHGHVAAANNEGVPADPHRWGWRRLQTGDEEYLPTTWHPQGTRIGWVSGDDLYLEPEAAYSAVQKMARDQGTTSPLSQTTLWKRVKEKGLLVSHDPERNVARATIAGERKRVLHLHIDALQPESGPTGPSGPPATGWDTDDARDGTGDLDQFRTGNSETGPGTWATTGACAHEGDLVGPTGPVGPVLVTRDVGDDTRPTVPRERVAL